jgi:uncharacterized protein YigE (DUF2233 family)
VKARLLFLTVLVASSTAPAFEYRIERAAGKEVIVCRVEIKRERLELFLRNDAGQPLKSFENLERWLEQRGRKLLFGMNAGMYHGDLSPVGLFANEGRQIAPLNLSPGEGNFFLKPNGVFLVASTGAHVLESSELLKFTAPIQIATQSGPLLVWGNKIHPAFKPDSIFKLLRNGVGVPSPDVALFAISKEPVNLYEFAAFFRDVLRCPDALYFDGTVSSLHSPELGRSDKLIDLGPIIGITAER